MIGKGFCGTVWAHDDDLAFRREDGGPERDLLNDYNIHKHLLNTSANHHLSTSQCFRIPQCHEFITAGDPSWAENPGVFPEQFTACRTLVSERVPSPSPPAREMLVDKYCPAHTREKIKANVSDRDCMVRPYLGKRRQESNRPPPAGILHTPQPTPSLGQSKTSTAPCERLRNSDGRGLGRYALGCRS